MPTRKDESTIMQRARIPVEEAFLRVAWSLSQRSTCLDKQVGCVITNVANEIIATGYNGAPHGWAHCIDNGYCLVEKFQSKDFCPSAHAEQNALTQCRVPEQIHTIYLTLSPCIGCIRAINNTPCKRIVFLHEHKHPEPRGMWKGEWVHYELDL
jgi:dCMP deaminase